MSDTVLLLMMLLFVMLVALLFIGVCLLIIWVWLENGPQDYGECDVSGCTKQATRRVAFGAETVCKEHTGHYM